MKYLLLTLIFVGWIKAENDTLTLKAVDEFSDRVIAELTLSVEADSLPNSRSDRVYFVPQSSATEAEKTKRGALIQGAEVRLEGPSNGWLYSSSIRVEGQTLAITIYSSRDLPQRKIVRETEFSVPLFKDLKGEKAGIKYSIAWNKKPALP